jgi:hypothetical protein
VIRSRCAAKAALLSENRLIMTVCSCLRRGSCRVLVCSPFDVCGAVVSGPGSIAQAATSHGPNDSGTLTRPLNVI